MDESFRVTHNYQRKFVVALSFCSLYRGYWVLNAGFVENESFIWDVFLLDFILVLGKVVLPIELDAYKVTEFGPYDCEVGYEVVEVDAIYRLF